MMRKEFELSDEQFAEIVKINKEGGDPVMFLSGGKPMGKSLQEKINDYWIKLERELGFDRFTIEPITKRKFTAVVKEKV